LIVDSRNQKMIQELRVNLGNSNDQKCKFKCKVDNCEMLIELGEFSFHLNRYHYDYYARVNGIDNKKLPKYIHDEKRKKNYSDTTTVDYSKFYRVDGKRLDEHPDLIKYKDRKEVYNDWCICRIRNCTAQTFVKDYPVHYKYYHQYLKYATSSYYKINNIQQNSDDEEKSDNDDVEEIDSYNDSEMKNIENNQNNDDTLDIEFLEFVDVKINEKSLEINDGPLKEIKNGNENQSMPIDSFDKSDHASNNNDENNIKNTIKEATSLISLSDSEYAEFYEYIGKNYSTQQKECRCIIGDCNKIVRTVFYEINLLINLIFFI
jgi:hypothetical protein